MDPITVSIVALTLAQVAVIAKVAMWAGEQSTKVESKQSKEEAATAKAAIIADAKAAAVASVDGAIRAVVAEAVSRVAADERSQIRDSLARLDASRDALAKLVAQSDRVLYLIDGLDKLETELDTHARDMRRELKEMRGAVGAFSAAASKMEWRIDNAEEMIRRKLGSHPRVFAVRPSPEELRPRAPLPIVIDLEETLPGLPRNPVALLPRPTPIGAPARQGVTVSRESRPSIPRADDDDDEPTSDDPPPEKRRRKSTY